MKRGAADFLEKTVDPEVLVDAIRSALDRQESERDRDAAAKDVRECYGSLTSREREVLAGMLKGRLNKQIASDLGISIKTVKVHRGRVMHKMQVRAVAQLVQRCEQARLTGA
jgi:FixJ family two-component response regulator